MSEIYCIETTDVVAVGGVNGVGAGDVGSDWECTLTLGAELGAFKRFLGKLARMVRMEAGEIVGLLCAGGFFVSALVDVVLVVVGTIVEVMTHSSSEESDSAISTTPRLVISTTNILETGVKKREKEEKKIKEMGFEFLNHHLNSFS